MSKYIHLYNVDSEFEEDYLGEGYGEPWVSRTLENDEINYNKKETTYYMYWGRSGTATVKTLGNVESGTSSGDLEIRTNEPSISSVTPTVGWITVTATTISVHYNISENTTSSVRTGSVTIAGPNGTSIVLNVTQVADTPYLAFSDTTATTKSLTFESGDTTTGVIGLSTNLTEVAVTKSGIVTATTVNKSGSTVTGITASFATATTTSDTTGSITISSGGSALTVTITENGRAYFSFTNGNTAITYDAITASTITSAGTPGYTIPYYTNFKGLYINNLPDNPVLNSGMFDSISISNRDGDGNLVFVVSALSSGDAARSGEIKLYPASGNSGAAGLQSGVCGDITVNQSAGSSWYLYLGASGQTTAQTATLPSTGTVGTTEAFVTNYTAEKISSDLSTSADTWISNITLSTTGISFDVAERQADFVSSARTGHIWVLGGASGTLTLTVNQAANPLYTISVDDASYTSDFTGNSWVKVTTNCPQEVLTALTVSATTMTDSSNLGIPVPANKFRKQNSTTETAVTSANCYVMLTTSSENTSTTTDRTNTIYIKSGSTVLAQSTVTHQKDSLYLYFNSNSAVTYTYPSQIEPSSTSITTSLYTNYSASDWSSTITYSADTWISNFVYDSNLHTITYNIAANPRGASSTTRTGHIWIKGGANGTLTITLTQKANLIYLYFNSSSATTYTYPDTASSAASAYSVSLYTNYTQTEWNNNITYSADTWLTGFSYTPSQSKFDFSTTESTSIQTRTGHIWIKGGANGTLTLTVNQSGKFIYLYVDSHSATTYTYPENVKAYLDSDYSSPITIRLPLYTNLTIQEFIDNIVCSASDATIISAIEYSYDSVEGNIFTCNFESNLTLNNERAASFDILGGPNGTLHYSFVQDGLYIRSSNVRFSDNNRKGDSYAPFYWHKIETNLLPEQLKTLTVSASTTLISDTSTNVNYAVPAYLFLTTECGSTSTDITDDNCYIAFKYYTNSTNPTARTQTIYVKSGDTVITSFSATAYSYKSYSYQPVVFGDMYSESDVINVVAESGDTAATVDIVCNYSSIGNFQPIPPIRPNTVDSGTTFSGIVTGETMWAAYSGSADYGAIYPNRITVYFTSATTSNVETGSVYIPLVYRTDSTGSCTVNVTRKGLDIPYFHWTYNDSTDISTSIVSAATIMACGYTVHNIDSFTLSSDTALNELKTTGGKVQVSVPANSNLNYRTIHIYVKSGTTILATWTISQAGSAYMYWDNSGTNTGKTLDDIAATGSSGNLVIRTNETSIASTSSTVDWIHVTATTGNVQYSVDENPRAFTRSGDVTITGQYGSSVVLTIVQNEADPYVYLVNGSDTAATTAATAYLSQYGQQASVGINTNTSTEWVQDTSNVTIFISTSDSWITANSINNSQITFTVPSRDYACSSSNRSGTITISGPRIATLTITVNQYAADTYRFAGSDVTVNYTQHRDSSPYTSNIPQNALSFSTNVNWISNISANEGRVYFNVLANTSSINNRVGSISAFNGYCSDAYVGGFQVTQDEVSDWLKFCDAPEPATALTVQVPATATTTAVCYDSSFTAHTTGGSSNISVNTGSTNNLVLTATFSANTSPYAGVAFTVNISSGNKTIILTIQQAPADAYLRWRDGGGTSKSLTFYASGGSISELVDTNCNYTGASDVGWITVSGNGSSNPVAATVDVNTAGTRTGTVTIHTTGYISQLTAALNVTQLPQGYVYLYSSGTATVGSQTFDYNTIRSGITYHLVNNTGITVSGPNWLHLTPGSSVVNYSASTNTGGERSGDIVINGVPNGGQARYTITQGTMPSRTVSLRCTSESYLNYSFQSQSQSVDNVTSNGVNFRIEVVDIGSESLVDRGGTVSLDSWGGNVDRKTTTNNMYGICDVTVSDSNAHTVNVYAEVDYSATNTVIYSANFTSPNYSLTSINTGYAGSEYKILTFTLPAGSSSPIVDISGGDINLSTS